MPINSLLPSFFPCPPDVEGIVDFLVREKSFDEARIRKAIKRVVDNRGKAGQSRMESFFTVRGTGGSRPGESPRQGRAELHGVLLHGEKGGAAWSSSYCLPVESRELRRRRSRHMAGWWRILGVPVRLEFFHMILVNNTYLWVPGTRPTQPFGPAYPIRCFPSRPVIQRRPRRMPRGGRPSGKMHLGGRQRKRWPRRASQA